MYMYISVYSNDTILKLDCVDLNYVFMKRNYGLKCVYNLLIFFLFLVQGKLLV